MSLSSLAHAEQSAAVTIKIAHQEVVTLWKSCPIVASRQQRCGEIATQKGLSLSELIIR